MKNTREGYEFPRKQRIEFRKKANKMCQFPGEECGNINDGKVHHLTGVFEARLNHMTPDSISDISLNAIMLCENHAFDHDEQEGLHVLKLGKAYVPDNEIYKVKRATATEHLIFLSQHNQELDEAA
jgi:hypothetical protein